MTVRLARRVTRQGFPRRDAYCPSRAAECSVYQKPLTLNRPPEPPTTQQWQASVCKFNRVHRLDLPGPQPC